MFRATVSTCCFSVRRFRPFCHSNDVAVQSRIARRMLPLGDATAQYLRLTLPPLRRPMREQYASRDRRSTDPETGVASGLPEAAMCVQDIDVQCVLQFTLVNAAGCALHRHTSRVIHRLEFSFSIARKEIFCSSERAFCPRACLLKSSQSNVK